MPEIYNKTYYPRNEATFGHRIFRKGLIPFADLTLDAAYTSPDLTVDFFGWSKQAFKIYPDHTGPGITVDVEIQEFLPFPGSPNDGDLANGNWGTKSGLGVGSADPDELFEHNQEDTMRLARMVLTPRTAVPANGIQYEISGRRSS